MPTLNDVLAGSLAQAVQVQQIIDALKGTPNKGVPIALVSLNDSTNYALTVQNDDPTNSRALLVLKADGSTLISADVTGVTLGSPVNLPAGSVNGGTALADGSVTTAKLANASVTNAKLASDTARASLLTNGGFEIWQRGNGPFTGTGTGFSADRWQILPTGSDTLSVSRDAGNNDSALGSVSAAACTFTLSGGAGTTVLYQQLKPGDFALANRTLSLSIRVKTSTASAVRVGLYNGSAYTFSAFHPGDGTWQTLSATATVIAAPTNIYAAVSFSASCTAYVDNAMLVVGAQPADYAPLHPSDDLARCLRYYEVLGPGQVALLTGMCFSTTASMHPWIYRVAKGAGTPSVTISANSDFQLMLATGSSQVLTGFSVLTAQAWAADLRPVVASGLVGGNATVLYALSANSKLIAEANP